MSILEELVSSFEIPKMAKIKQYFPRPPKLEDPPESLRQAVAQSGILDKLSPGQTVAISGTSRGISNAVPIYRALVDLLKQHGANPFLFPAMGSHGGATAEGQREILASLGLAEDICGCPIKSSMETVFIGNSEKNGLPVHVDKYAYEADFIVLVGRIKPHTSFRGPVESGLAKMAAIGVGKQKGAELCHTLGMKNMSENIMEIADHVFRHCNVLCGIGLLENCSEETSRIVCLKTEEILEKEPVLLKEAFELLPCIYFPRYDILILDEIGKQISGTGMDCNIVSRYTTDAIPPEKRQTIITILDLTNDSHGNANGMGLANISTKRFYNKVDFESTYANPLTALCLETFRLPMILASDKTAIQASIKFCIDSDRKNLKIIRAKNTLHISELYISEALLEEARRMPHIEILEDPQELVFDEHGNLF